MRTSTARPYGNVPFLRPTRFVIKHFVMRVVEGADPYKYYAAFTVGEGLAPPERIESDVVAMRSKSILP